MGNYSWILRILNCKNTNIDWNTVLKNYPDICNEYGYSDKNTHNIKSLYDFACKLDDTKLFGYLCNKLIKLLCKICLHTSYTNEFELNKTLPRMYFEEEGWDRIHFLEFHCGTEEIIWGSYAFNFMHNKWIKRLYMNKQKNENDEYNDIEYFESKYEEYNDKEIDISLYDNNYDILDQESREKYKDYVLNLVHDKFTNWKTNKLNYEKSEYTSNVIHLMNLVGIRSEDIKLDPLGSFEKLLSKGVNPIGKLPLDEQFSCEKVD